MLWGGDEKTFKNVRYLLFYVYTERYVQQAKKIKTFRKRVRNKMLGLGLATAKLVQTVFNTLSDKHHHILIS